MKMKSARDIILAVTRFANDGNLEQASNLINTLWERDKTNAEIYILSAKIAITADLAANAHTLLNKAEILAPQSSDPKAVITAIEDLRYTISHPNARKEDYPSAQPTYESDYEAWLRDDASLPIQPLLDGRANFAVFFNAHCANTTIANWYFKRLNLIDPILLLSNVSKHENSSVISEYNSAMHKFRRTVYYDSEYYRESERRYLTYIHGYSDERWYSYKFVRNPYRRLLGLYLLHMRENDISYGVTFREFVSALSKENLPKIDMHMRPQFYSFESLTKQSFTRVFKIEEGIDNHLRTILREIGHAKNDEISIDLETRNFTQYNPSTVRCMADTNFLGEIFADKKAPNVQSFYDDHLLEMVFEMYPNDFAAYNYRFGEL